MRTQFPTLLGYTLFRLRTEKNCTQKQLAKEAKTLFSDTGLDEDVWATFISRLESGEHKGGVQDRRKLVALARCLNVSDDCLVNLAQPLPASPSPDIWRTIVDNISPQSRQQLKDELNNQPEDQGLVARHEKIENLREIVLRLEYELKTSTDTLYTRQVAVHLSKHYARLSNELTMVRHLDEAAKASELSREYRLLAIDQGNNIGNTSTSHRPT